MGAECSVIARVAGQHRLRVGQAVAAGHALGGSRQQLQQAAGIGGGDGGGVEGAFLPGDRIGKRLSGAGNIGAGGNDAERIGECGRIDTAAEGRLADLQRDLMIAVALSPRRQNGKLAGTVELFGQRPVKAVGAPAITCRLQAVYGAHGFAAGKAFSVAIARAGIGHVQRLRADPCSGKLAVKRTGMGCRLCKEVACIAGSSGFGRPSEPVIGAGG